MTTATTQQTQIIRLCQVMFNAAPGAVYLDSFTHSLAVNPQTTVTNLANDLARSSVFTSSFSSNASLTNAEFAEHLVTKVVGDTISVATHNAAVSAITDTLNAGVSRGELMLAASDVLANVTAFPEWAVAAAQFNNRVEVASYYSIDRAGGATNLATLQAVIANVTDSAASVIAGKAVFDAPVTGQDSNISGAIVFADLNGDGFRDLTEPYATTDIHGGFTLPDGSFGRLVASGGHDMTTNLLVSGDFTAPPGSTVINPLTTLVQALVDSGTDIALANAWVLSSLGLPAGTDLTSFAPLDEIPGVNSAAAVQILAASVQANNIFRITATALVNADVTLDMKTAFAQVVSAMAEQITSATSVLDLTNAALLREVIVTSAGNDPAMIASMADLNTPMASLLADNNTTIDQIIASGNSAETMRTQILQVARIVQGRESTALALDVGAGTPLAALLTAYTGTTFDTLVSHALLGDVDGDGDIDLPIALPVASTPDPAPAADTTAPTLSASTPADNATGILVGSNLVLTFNESLQLTGAGNIVLRATTGDAIIETFNMATGLGSAGGLVSVSGTAVTINPAANLSANTQYYLTVDSTAVKDTAGNSYAGISSTTALNFTTNADGVAPTLSSSTPADDATAVALGSDIVLTFSENVAAGTGNILIRKVSDGSTVATIPVGSAQVTFNGTTGVTINPTADLISGIAYYVTMASGVITDTAGNPYAGIIGATTLNFTPLDIAPPALSSSTPVDSATGTLVGSNLVLTFNEAIALGTGNIVLLKGDGSVIETFNVATGTGNLGGTVTASGTGVTINPFADLAVSTDYYLTVAATAVTDISLNPYAGISATTDLNFTTSADGVAPTLSLSTPADNATAVADTANIVLTFSENVVAGTGNILIRKADNTIVATIPVGDAQVTFNGTTGVTINPTANLTEGTAYYVTMASGVITDTAGNPYAGIILNSTLNFTTAADITPPTLSSSTPADNATGILVGSNLVLTFNETIALGTGNIVLLATGGAIIETFNVATGLGSGGGTVTASGTGVTINPFASLTSSTEYYLTVAATAVTDTAGNPYAGISSTTALSFTTNADGAAPTLSSSTPADNAVAVAVIDNIVLTFSENVVAGTGNILIRKVSNDFVVATIPVGNAQVTFNGTTGVTINPTENLAADSYYVEMASGVITDTAGNPYDGISAKTTLNFTTQADFALAVVGGEVISGNAGDNSITGTYTDGGTGTFNNTDTIDGSGGTDTLSITVGAVAITPADSYWTGVSGIEKIAFDSTGAGAQTLTTGASFNTAFTAAGVDITMQTLLGAINLDMATVPFTGAATIHTNTIGAGAHTITTGSGAATVQATGQAAGSQTIKGAGLTSVTATINNAGDQIIGDAAGNGVNLVTVTATIGGAGAQTITSTSASNVTVTAVAAAGAQTITTGAGDDTITLTSATGQVSTITTNAGNDTIVASLATDLITGGLGADSMTGGGAADTFAFGANGSVLGTSMDIITDFNTGGADILSFDGNTTVTADATALVAGSGAGSNVQTSAGGLITFHADDSSLALKIAAVQADTQLDALGSIAMFVDGGNTYVYYAGAATGNADDQLIQLSGITTLLTITGGATSVIG